MTGFAFYSCDDVVDNPAQATTSVWNYSVSVKFADFTGITTPYQGPTTLYVFNEEMTPMGTITAEAAPAAGDYGTYAGTITGAIGDNLIIMTKVGDDLAKQDGTEKSAVENGIVQTAKVPIKIYNANSQKVTTAAAVMENTCAIVKLASNEVKGGDKVKITTKDQSFDFTINSEFDPTVSNILYAAIPTIKADDKDITISTNSVDGFMRGYTLTSAAYPLTNGKINDYTATAIPFEKTGVDLTIWDAYKLQNDADYKSNVEDQIINNFPYPIPDDKSFIITQSGEKTLDLLNVIVSGTKDKDVSLTIDNVRLGERCYFTIQNGAKFALNLINDNKFGGLNLNSPYTKKGEGSWKFEELNVGGDIDWNTTHDTKLEIYTNKVNYFAEYTINEDMTLRGLNVYEGGKINIADGKKVKVINKNSDLVTITGEGTLNIGKGAELYVETTGIATSPIMSISGGYLNIGEKTIVTVKGYKDNTALDIQSGGTWGSPYSTIKIGEGAKVDLCGGIENSLGQGLTIQSRLGGTVSIDLAKNATLTATGISQGAMSMGAGDWRTSLPTTARPSTININIAEGAKIIANETAESFGLYYSSWTSGDGSTPTPILNITGKGAFEAKSVAGLGMALDGKVNITGVDVTATGGTEKPAIKTFATTALTLTYSKDSATKLTAKAGTGSTICIADADDKELAKFAEASYTDTTADGVRTITPKAPAE